jgi:hypothetical protein
MRPWLFLALPFLALGPALLACSTEETVEYATCTLDAPAASPTTAAPGDTVVLTSSPLTEVWDTVVLVGGARAELVSLDRTDCDDCDDCLDEAECDACDLECEDCTETCATCVETVTIVVPSVAAGEQDVQLLNRYGRSALGTLTVLAGDTGDTDTGLDTGDTDTGLDTGDTDTGDTAVDTGTDTADTAVDTGVDTGDTSGTDTGDTAAP